MKTIIRLSIMISILILILAGCGGLQEKDLDSELMLEDVPMVEDIPYEPVMMESEADAAAKSMAADILSDKKELLGTKRSKSPKSRPKKIPQKASGLRAGFADDNKQFNYFVNFLEKYADSARHYKVNITERVIITVKDAQGMSVPSAMIQIHSGKSLLAEGKTYSDGSFLFFPSEHKGQHSSYKVTVAHNQQRKEITLDRQGERKITVKLPAKRSIAKNIPLDMVFILDTTGSMGEEIARLKNTIELINLNISEISPRPDVRFGLVLYKDKNEPYITEVIQLTNSLEGFSRELQRVSASGGGDGPEDLQSALKATMKYINWNTDGIRLAFIITDAPPHLDYGQKYDYTSAMHEARQKGVKIFSVGTGGLDISGEYVLRQISQYTAAKYIFLTYGERGESAGGKAGSVSHHTGSNYTTGKLDSVIIRFAREELENVAGKSVQGDEYFTATKTDEEDNSETMGKLFDRAAGQLVDYSSMNISDLVAVALFPLEVNDKGLLENAEYFGEHLTISLSRNKTFMLLERKDIQKVIDEAKFQLSGYVPEDEAVEAGQLAGAKVIITGKMYARTNKYELLLKMIRVETGEVLSVTKLMITKDLGLELKEQ